MKPGVFLKYKWKEIGAFFLFAAILLLCLLLNGIDLAVLWYPLALCALIGLFFLLYAYKRCRKTWDALERISSIREGLTDELPDADSPSEVQYQKIIGLLCEGQKEEQKHLMERYNDMRDYYTTWAHQIKTPIASMRLNLQGEDSSRSRKLLRDLRRIEQYVEMVMTYLRLDSGDTDYVIKRHDLDTIVKGCVRNFAGDFIGKKLRLVYEPLKKTVLTDEKWLAFVIEQILSNALKYTQAGEVRIYMEADSLCIRDTGIGIAPADLPRIFEKGFTGFNGRQDKKASGIGLYLCRRICDNLGHGISVESTVKEGTVVKLDLHTQSLFVE